MKKIGILFLMSFFVFAGSNGFSQKLKSGDLSILKGQKVINLQYDYSKMKVGKYDNEEEYIKDGTADRNQKKPGSGDEWATKWRSDKEVVSSRCLRENLMKCSINAALKAN